MLSFAIEHSVLGSIFLLWGAPALLLLDRVYYRPGRYLSKDGHGCIGSLCYVFYLPYVAVYRILQVLSRQVPVETAPNIFARGLLSCRPA